MTDATTDQAAPQPVTDRIANKFGFPGNAAATQETPTETAGGETAAGSDLAELEWDGEKFQVPAKLKDAFMRNDDYTRKTQDLAEQRRTVDHVRELATQAQADRAFGESISAESQELN